MKLRRGLLAAVLLTLTLPVACSSDSNGEFEQSVASVEFIAKITQDGPAFSLDGYVTSVTGVDASVLFTDPAARGEATARITLHADGTMTGRTNVENVFSLDVSGDVRFFVQDAGGATFDAPSSFTSDVGSSPIPLTLHNIITVIAPNQGVSYGSADVVFTDGLELTVAGERVMLMAKDSLARLVMTGSGTRLEPRQPQAAIVVAGDISAR